MAARTRLLALLGAAAVLVGIGLLGWSLGSGGPSAGPVADAPGSMAPAPGPATSPPAGSPSGGETGSPAESASPSASLAPNSTGGAEPSGDAGTTTPPVGIEVLPSPSTAPSGGSQLLPGLPKPSKFPESLLTAVPEPATTTGELAAGFPAELAPPDGSTIESSSLSVAGRRVQAALVAEPTGGARALLLHYRTVLGQRGFEELPVQAPENAPAAAFRHGDDTVSITLQDGVCYLLANLRVTG